MFFTLLLVTLLVSIGVAFLVVRLFDRSLKILLARIVTDELSSAWHRYITFAAYVVGISGGVRIHHLQRYIDSGGTDSEPTVLTLEHWTLELYRTVIETLQSMAWLFLLVFMVALIAFVIVRGFELRASARSDRND